MKMKAVLVLILVFVASCSKGPLTFRNEENLSSTGPLDRGLLNIAESRLRLAPRTFVATTLNDIFGTSIEATTQDLIGSRVGQFGGPCDPAIPNDCQQGGDSLAPMVPVANSARAALSTRACDKIASSDAAVTFAGAQASTSGTTAITTRNPNQAEIAAMYDLFFPGRTPNQEILTNLAAIATDARNLNYSYIESWRFILLTLCLSPDWQIP
jgi:hypothetical protein